MYADLNGRLFPDTTDEQHELALWIEADATERTREFFRAFYLDAGVFILAPIVIDDTGAEPEIGFNADFVRVYETATGLNVKRLASLDR